MLNDGEVRGYQSRNPVKLLEAAFLLILRSRCLFCILQAIFCHRDI